MWTLKSTEAGDEQAWSFRILPGGMKTVGRAVRADFIVDAALVSRLHCRLTSDANGTLRVEDLRSTNGTFVNDRRVTQSVLVPGDRLRVGRVELIVERAGSAVGDAPSEPPTSTSVWTRPEPNDTDGTFGFASLDVLKARIRCE